MTFSTTMRVSYAGLTLTRRKFEKVLAEGSRGRF